MKMMERKAKAFGETGRHPLMRSHAFESGRPRSNSVGLAVF